MTLLYLYISIFTLYFIVLALISTKPAKKVRDKYTSKDSNLCVVVYTTGESQTFENLIKQLKAKFIIVGSDCSFGAGASGNANLLKDIANSLGVDVHLFT